ncbi:MAG: 5-(carboxyamino)imidazole ribonucleotide synthase [Gammaproteobacteria bacterium]|nr:5-(carboxyamino)imidazole ribonucleotide synthase [Gammaproteobacteria bacterium]
MRRLWVLGNGQLGAMLKYAGESLDVDVIPLAIDNDEPLSLAANDVVTAEREHWPDTTVTKQLFQYPNFKNRRAFIEIADRLSEKALFDRLDLATAPWCSLDEQTSESDLFARLGSKVVLKRRSGGYDGKGQQWLRESSHDTIAQDWRGQAIVEQAISFDEEVSLVGARSASGELVFYPLTLNLHQDGILLASIAPLARLQQYQSQAEAMLTKLMNEFDYIGVLAMECFRVGDQLMINEVAPRVHNSGHWTMTGATISQFELHVSAVMGLPVFQPKVNDVSVMINLLGLAWDPRWTSAPNATVYWYDKEVLPGRKLGHINLNVANVAQLDDSLAVLKGLLSERYNKMFAWLRQHTLT